MVQISSGDMARTYLMQRHTSVLRQTIEKAAAEVTTGQTADLGRHLRGDVGMLAAMDTSLARLDGYRTNTARAAVVAESMQAALSSIDALTDGILPGLLNSATTGWTAATPALAEDARQRFGATVAILNGFVGDRALFSGTQSDTAPLIGADSILQEIESVVGASGAVTVTDVAAAISDWFDDPAGFATFAYRGAAEDPLFPIGEGEAVTLAPRATVEALRDTLKGLATASLAGAAGLSLAPETRRGLLTRAGETLMGADSARVTLASDLGIVEARIEAAATRNDATATALQLARSRMVSADPYTAATELEAAQTRLETLFSITARLSRLNLTDFLR